MENNRGYRFIESLIGGVFLIVSIYFFIWAGLIVVMQGVGWLVNAQWQPVPIGALFLSIDGHQWMTHFSGKSQPLNIVPAWGHVENIEQISVAFAGSLAGVQKITLFVLDSALAGWLIAVGFICLSVSNGADTSP